MAFAARIQPVESQNRQTMDAPPHRSGNDSAPVVRHNTAEAGQSDATPPVSSPTPSQPASPAFAVQSFQTQAPRIAYAAQPAAQPPSPAAQIASEEPVAPKPPATNISLQVGSAKGEVVEVRLTERAGELRVAVRTPDSDIAQGLRQGLSDLTTKLNDNGYRAETWHPADTSSLTFSAPRESGNNQGQSSNSGSQQQNQQGSQQQDGGRQNQNSSNRPRWVQELESNMRSGSQNSGGSYGFSR